MAADERFSHDQAFKNIIQDYPLQSLRAFAGEEGRLVQDDARVTFLREEQLKLDLKGSFRILDAPVLVEPRGAEQEAVVFLLEEQTHPSQFDIFTLAHYCLDLGRALLKSRGLRSIVPVVIFLRPGFAPETLRLGTQRTTFLEFQYVASQLSQWDAKAFIDSDNIVLRMNLPNMQYEPEEKVRVCVEAVRGIMQLEESEQLQRKYLGFVHQYADFSQQEAVEYKRELARSQEGKAAMSFLEHVKAEGQAEGRAAALLRFLERRRLTLTPAQRERVQSCTDAAQLDEWIDRVVDARSADEVFGPVKH